VFRDLTAPVLPCRRTLYGLAARSWVVDLDSDLVMEDCDQQDSGMVWLESDGKKPPSFTPHPFPKTASGTRGS
jgi:hypothetical protein